MHKDLIQTAFEKIAKKLTVAYEYKEIHRVGIDNLTISYHTLVIPYRHNTIRVEYEFGDLNTAEITTALTNPSRHNQFTIQKNGPYKLLFFRNKKSLEVTSTSTSTALTITKLLESTGLEAIALGTQFDPKIKFQTSKNKTQLVTRYYLGFKDKEKSILPIINFYKGIIDTLV